MRRAKLVEPTEVFGDYLVFERLGIGGMATVHRAIRRGIEGFEQVVALKRLLPHLAADGQFVESFVREAKLASLLQHQRIIQIYDLGCFSDTYFIAMEYIDGCDLREILRRAHSAAGPPPMDVVLSILGELCEGLHYAHTRVDANQDPLGLVHRDVSPSNLIISRSGNLKVIDFGIAKATAGELRTDSGRIKGKCPYMSPEAIKGKSLDARSDIFSTGVIAFEMLTARPLFASKNDYETLTKVQFAEAFPPSIFNRECPLELDDVILRALEKEPDARWSTVAEMRQEIDKVALQHKIHPTSRRVAQWMEKAFAGEAADAERAALPTKVTGNVRMSTPPPIPVSPGGGTRVPEIEPRSIGDLVKIVWGPQEKEEDDVPTLDDVPNAPFEIEEFAPLGGELLPAGETSKPPAGPGLLSSARLVDAPPDDGVNITFRDPTNPSAPKRAKRPSTKAGWDAPLPLRAAKTPPVRDDGSSPRDIPELARLGPSGAASPRMTTSKGFVDFAEPGGAATPPGPSRRSPSDTPPEAGEQAPAESRGAPGPDWKAWALVGVLSVVAVTLAVIYFVTH